MMDFDLFLPWLLSPMKYVSMYCFVQNSLTFGDDNYNEWQTVKHFVGMNECTTYILGNWKLLQLINK